MIRQIGDPKSVPHVWFKHSSDKMPPSYQVYFSASEIYQSLYSATVIARNTDSPVPDDGDAGFWIRASQTSRDDLKTAVDNELRQLNGMKEINCMAERWPESLLGISKIVVCDIFCFLSCRRMPVRLTLCGASEP